MTRQENCPTSSPADSDNRFIHRALLVVGIVAAVLMLSGVFAFLVDTVLIFFGAVLLALALRKLGDTIASWTGTSEYVGFLLGVSLLLLVLAGGGALLGPYLFAELKEVGPKFADAIQEMGDKVGEQGWVEDVRKRLEESDFSFGSFASNASSGVIPGAAMNLFTGSFGFIATFSLILIVGFWIAWQPRIYLEIGLKLAPLSVRDHLRSVFEETGHVLTDWVLARLVAMLIVGTLTTIALLVLQVPLAFTLGILAGLISFVPTIGAFLAILPALVIAIPQGMDQVGWVLACYVVIQLLENNLITPLVMQRAVSIPPAIVLLMQLAMGLLVGGLGVAFAVPLAAGGAVLVKRLYIEDVLKDKEPGNVKPRESKSSQDDALDQDPIPSDSRENVESEEMHAAS